MMKKKSNVVRVWSALILLFSALNSVWGMGRPPTRPAPTARPVLLLVVPARYTVVQLAFDIQKIRPLTTLVAYDDQAPKSVLGLHCWDVDIRDWTRIDLDQYRSGRSFRSAPQAAVLVGTIASLPLGLHEATRVQDEPVSPTALDLAAILNAVHESQDFTAREWRWLAERYNIKIEDINAERRRYGRFGKSANDGTSVPRAKEFKDDDLLPEPMAVPSSADHQPDPDVAHSGITSIATPADEFPNAREALPSKINDAPPSLPKVDKDKPSAAVIAPQDK